MARVHATRLESLAVTRANNPWPVAEFPARAPGLDWAAFLDAAHLGCGPAHHRVASGGDCRIVCARRKRTAREVERLAAVPHRGLPSDLLPRAFADERFAFHGHTLAGIPSQSERWKRAVSFTSNGTLGEAVGRLYVREHFPPETKARAQALVQAISAAFGQRIERLDWMSPATKAKAREKLSTLYVGIGYPDRWTRDYTALEVRRGDALGNAERASRFDYLRNIAKLDAPVDRTEWSMTPQTVNAVNLPLQNALNFPAAILEAPFFDAAASDAVNYGAIGSVIGHEISHSFDDQGALFDARGRLANWWTKEDFAHFTAAGAQLAAQYDAYEPFSGLHVNGRLTLSENIADLAGLSATYDAWKASRRRASRTAGRRVHRRAATVPELCADLAVEDARGRTAPADRHERPRPDDYRAATVRNLDESCTPPSTSPRASGCSCRPPTASGFGERRTM